MSPVRKVADEAARSHSSPADRCAGRRPLHLFDLLCGLAGGGVPFEMFKLFSDFGDSRLGVLAF
jgi:hypothetical protein